MNTYDRHLLREWLTILGLVLCAAMGLLLIQVMYDDFRALRELGARGYDLWSYMFVTMPSKFTVVLPLALLVSLMFTLGKLHRANEFTALRAAGVGLGRITAPIWLIGALACGLSWWLNTEVVPWSVEKSQEMRDRLQFQKEANAVAGDSGRVGLVYSVAFDNTHGRRMWFFNRYSQYTKRGYGVTVSTLNSTRRELSRIVAAEAWFDPATGWNFKDGRELEFRAETGELMSTEPFARRTEATFHEDPQLMLLIDRRYVDLSLPQIERLMTYFEAENSPKLTDCAVHYYGLIATTFGPLIVIMIAIPFAVTGVRVNPAVGASKSIGLFFLYYLMDYAASALATKGLVEPALAAWLPNLGMMGLAAWFLWRMR
ncbi:MAG: LptF/LptG family permease [Verrucomicrobia bacterium]|nr:LptF/LptG family permease [Verrucomicrobiota bacterium]